MERGRSPAGFFTERLAAEYPLDIEHDSRTQAADGARLRLTHRRPRRKTAKSGSRLLGCHSGLRPDGRPASGLYFPLLTTRLTFVPPGSDFPAPALCETTLPFLKWLERAFLTLPTAQ